MNNLNQTQKEQKISNLERLINNRTEEFIGSIEDFEVFLMNATTRQLHALNSNEYAGRKPNFVEYEDIISNIRILESMMTLMVEKQHLEEKLKN